MNLDENVQTLVALFFSLSKAQRTAFLREVAVRMAESATPEPASQPLDLSPCAPSTLPHARTAPLPADDLPALAAPAPAFDGRPEIKKKRKTYNKNAFTEKFKSRADKEIAALAPPTSFRPLGRLEDIDDAPTKRRAVILARLLRKQALDGPFRAPDVLELNEPYLTTLWTVKNAANALTELGVLGYRKLSPQCSNAKVYWRNPKWK